MAQMTGTTAADTPIVTTMKVIWVALTASIGIYVALLFFLAPGLAGGAANPVMQIVFYGQSVMLGLASFGYRRWALSDERLRQALAGVEAEAARTDAVLSQLNTVNIVCLALHEAIALFGFVLGFLGGGAFAIVPFAVAALAMNAAIFPRPGPLLERARNLSLTPAAPL